MLATDAMMLQDYYTPENFKKIGHNLLFVAAKYGDLVTVQRLLQRPQADHLCQQHDKYGRSALMLALLPEPDEPMAKKDERLEIVRLLIKQIPLGITCLYGKNALSLAVCNGHMAALTLILQQSASWALINQKDINGLTPAMLAAKRGFLDILECLVARGADLTQCCHEKGTILMHAAANNQEKVVAYLLESPQVQAQINARDQHQETALFYALHARSIVITQTLLQYGADITPKNLWGQTVFEKATFQRQKEIVACLQLEQQKQAALIFSSEQHSTFTPPLKMRR